MSSIKVGDIVRLKSGGPVMDVAKIRDGQAVCHWFDEEPKAPAIKVTAFPVAALEITRAASEAARR